MIRTGIFFLTLPVLCLADVGVMDHFEPFLNTNVVATNAGHVVDVLEERGWSLVEATGVKVTAARTTDDGEERLSFEFSTADDTILYEGIIFTEYRYVPWLEYGVQTERWEAMFDRLVEAYDYLIGPGVTETSDTGIVHTWPGRESRIELILKPVWDSQLTASVDLVPLHGKGGTRQWEAP